VALLLIIAAYLCARSWSARLTPSTRATLDNSALIWHYTTLQGVAYAGAINLLPRFMN
jgi:cytochrome c oxidase subunit I+III